MEGNSVAGALGQAGYAITGSGGGGAGGQYVFVSVEQLDAIITEAGALLADIRLDGDQLRQAAGLIEPPADDIMSVMEARTTVESLTEAERHNKAMAAYVEAEMGKLQACRAAYVNTEDASAAQLRRVGED
jgi:hypothetical protein